MSTKKPVKITNATLKSLKATGKPYQVRDVTRPGFGCQISATGNISFFYRYRLDGKREFLSLGRWGAIDLDRAHEKYREALEYVESGRNPRTIRPTKKTKGVTLGQAFDDYKEVFDELKPATIRDLEGAQRNLEDWNERLLTSITGIEVLSRHREIGKRSKARANATMRWLRAVFNFSIEHYETPSKAALVTDNPVLKLTRMKKWYKPQRKRTLIKEHQLKAWFSAVLALADTPEREPGTGKAHPKMKQGPLSRDFFLFVLLTGLRRQEAATLMWDRVDMKGKTATFEDTKANRVHTLPLTSYLIELLKRRKKEGRGAFVFSNLRGEKIDNLRYALARVAKQSGVQFTVHDLRRSFATAADRLEISYSSLKALLNHSTKSDVTQDYVVVDVERLRAPMEKITDYFLKAAGLKPGAEVVNLADRKEAGQ